MELSTRAVAPAAAAAADVPGSARFEAIYRANCAAVHAYARRRLPERADDVVAETFPAAWRRLDDVPRDPLPWLYGVARRVVADRRRAASRQDAVARRVAEVREVDAAPVPSDLPLDDALRRLPELDRELLFLLYREDLEPARAAAALGRARATVATRLWRAQRRLRRDLNGGDDS